VITVPERYTQTDGQTTCDRNTALCTKVHRAVKTAQHLANTCLHDTTTVLYTFSCLLHNLKAFE